MWSLYVVLDAWQLSSIKNIQKSKAGIEKHNKEDLGERQVAIERGKQTNNRMCKGKADRQGSNEDKH